MLGDRTQIVIGLFPCKSCRRIWDLAFVVARDHLQRATDRVAVIVGEIGVEALYKGVEAE